VTLSLSNTIDVILQDWLWLLVSLEHTQQRLPQVLKPKTEYATFVDVEDAQRLPIFLIQEGRPRSWSYRKQGLHGPEMGTRRWGKRA